MTLGLHQTRVYSSLQEMHGEARTYEVLLQGLANLQLCLNSTAPEARIQELSEDFAQLKERYTSVKISIGRRYFFNFSII